MARIQSTSAVALIEPTDAGPAHRRLAEGIRAAIREGRLQPGDALPASRNLSADLGLSRWVVTEAYQQLIAEGYLVARAGSATRIASSVSRSTPWSSRAESAAAVLAGAVDLRPGLPDLAAFPRTAWSRAYSSAVRTLEPEQWRYPDPLGVGTLRSTVADYLRRVRGVDADPDRVVITAGTADAMRQLSRVLAANCSAGLAVEDPGWPVLAAAAQFEGLAVHPVPVDSDGLVVDDLPADSGAVLVTPAHQFPTGVTLSPARRSQLLSWAADTGALVIEDDYDAEFRYDRQRIGSSISARLAKPSLLPSGWVGWSPLRRCSSRSVKSSPGSAALRWNSTLWLPSSPLGTTTGTCDACGGSTKCGVRRCSPRCTALYRPSRWLESRRAFTC
jgi:GntR family transcriptional regulator / MocR family aminotransferase